MVFSTVLFVFVFLFNTISTAKKARREIEKDNRILQEYHHHYYSSYHRYSPGWNLSAI